MTKQEREELRRAHRDYKNSHHVLGDTILVFEAIPKLLDALDAQDKRIKELEARLTAANERVDQWEPDEMAGIEP